MDGWQTDGRNEGIARIQRDGRIRTQRSVKPPGLVRTVIQPGIEAALAITGGEVLDGTVEVRRRGGGLGADGSDGDGTYYVVIAIHKLANRDGCAESPGDSVFGDG